MVFVSVKVGPKGQVVIPKIFRDEYGIVPGDEILLGEEHGHGVKELVVKKNNDDFITYLDEFAKKNARKGFRYDSDAAHEEMMAERFPAFAPAAQGRKRRAR